MTGQTLTDEGVQEPPKPMLIEVTLRLTLIVFALEPSVLLSVIVPVYVVPPVRDRALMVTVRTPVDFDKVIQLCEVVAVKSIA